MITIKFPTYFAKTIETLNPDDFHHWFVQVLEAAKENKNADFVFEDYKCPFQMEAFHEAIFGACKIITLPLDNSEYNSQAPY